MHIKQQRFKYASHGPEGNLGLYRDNGKENGDYYIIIGYMLGLYWGSIIEGRAVKVPLWTDST